MAHRHTTLGRARPMPAVGSGSGQRNSITFRQPGPRGRASCSTTC